MEDIFSPAEQLPIPEWSCAVNKRLQPTITVKDDDLFLVTDEMGGIFSCSSQDDNPSMGLFCSDTRFLSRLEMEIEGRSLPY